MRSVVASELGHSRFLPNPASSSLDTEGIRVSLCYEDVLGSGGIVPLFLTSVLNGDVVSFTLLPFTLGDVRRLGGPQTLWRR
jgi:hypothetical protein